MLEGEATLTADDATKHGPPVRIGAGDMVTFPKGWAGRWEVHSFLKKRYAFFDGEGLRVDEDVDDDSDGAAAAAEEVEAEAGGAVPGELNDAEALAAPDVVGREAAARAEKRPKLEPAK